MNTIRCRIKENSRLARLAAWKLKGSGAAIVFGNVIHLYGVSRGDFLANVPWVRHEVCHVKQYRKYGFWRFLWLYVAQWTRVGYRNISFEKEARLAERNAHELDGVEIT
ncbi:DUF4157 domain-containing protein [Chitinophaga cymbidii]|uniref:DUF4157 domain-containing protein n=1 Tax=Chitinophaga cymbidii TaxID=1096750 RepID=A0A512RIW2_9BACT|nr:DUF4157 domain-containing protein [Chitinophaga cymbidii]GEP95604.1 hypothetical protein CCY01nite_18640 [Chitinophaga cymbidii]